VRDRQSGSTELVSVSTDGAQGNDDSAAVSISEDGWFVAFHSAATNLVAGDTNARNDVFLRDRGSGTTIRVSVSTLGAQGNGHSTLPAISGDGRYVTYTSEASNLVLGDTNGTRDVFLFDGAMGRTERVSVSATGEEANRGGQNGVISD